MLWSRAPGRLAVTMTRQGAPQFKLLPLDDVTKHNTVHQFKTALHLAMLNITLKNDSLTEIEVTRLGISIEVRA